MPGASIYHQLAPPPPQQMTSKPDVHPATSFKQGDKPKGFLSRQGASTQQVLPRKASTQQVLPSQELLPSKIGASIQQALIQQILPSKYLASKELLPCKYYPARSLSQQGAYPSKELIPARSLSQQVLTQQDLPSKILATTQHVLPRKKLKPSKCLPTKFYPAST